VNILQRPEHVLKWCHVAPRCLNGQPLGFSLENRLKPRLVECQEAGIPIDSTAFNDPVALLQAIKEHSLNYQDARHEMSIVSDAFRAVFGSKQREAESLQDCTRRFKTSTQTLESHLGGPVILEKHTSTVKGYDASNDVIKEKLTKEASECLFACLCLENSDQGKHGTITQNLNSQKSLGDDKCPRTIVETNNVLSSHKFDPNKSNKQDARQQHQKSANKDKNEGEDDESAPLSFAQPDGRKMPLLWKTGHKSPDCRNKAKIPKEEWAINKAQQRAQSKINDDQSVSGSTVASNRTSELLNQTSDGPDTLFVCTSCKHEKSDLVGQ
jgi:hypothetical protein